jgi:hypothetical protein
VFSSFGWCQECVSDFAVGGHITNNCFLTAVFCGLWISHIKSHMMIHSGEISPFPCDCRRPAALLLFTAAILPTAAYRRSEGSTGARAHAAQAVLSFSEF